MAEDTPVEVEVFPVTDGAKHFMSSSPELDSILDGADSTTLHSALVWIKNPYGDGIPELMGIRKTGEPDPLFEDLAVYCARVKLPSSYLDKYKDAIEHQRGCWGSHEVISCPLTRDANIQNSKL